VLFGTLVEAGGPNYFLISEVNHEYLLGFGFRDLKLLFSFERGVAGCISSTVLTLLFGTSRFSFLIEKAFLFIILLACLRRDSACLPSILIIDGPKSVLSITAMDGSSM